MFKQAQRQRLFNGRKVVEEFRERSAMFQLIEERPSGYPCTDKDGRPSENAGIRMDAGNLALHGTTSPE